MEGGMGDGRGDDGQTVATPIHTEVVVGVEGVLVVDAVDGMHVLGLPCPMND